MSDQKFELILNKLESMENEIQIIKTQLDENTQIVKAIRHRQEETDAKLDAILLDISYTKGDINTLKASQDRQDKILETLALRSIEQETELRDMKRVK